MTMKCLQLNRVFYGALILILSAEVVTTTGSCFAFQINFIK